MVVKILKSAYQGMIRHVESGYPVEVCGVLIGRDSTISTFRECKNVIKDNARNRYELDPVSFKDADDWARENKMDILGIYHSHPDHPSLPSEHDRSRAWPGWVYIIFSVLYGHCHDARAWLIDDFKSKFQEKQIDLLQD